MTGVFRFVAARQVEWFCFPNGLFLVSSAGQPAPHVSSFVRFTSGVRSYGLCLTFYRQVDTSEAMDAGLGESTVEASPDTEGEMTRGVTSCRAGRLGGA